ncbi:MAG TPA: xanthine dehydrogenase family protein subunit M [Candidatus Limnocylindria bacterium]|nr:xanthine dehydrogenase family protein subunit M [Candidatus Limnocylindria bacterium]
MRSPLSSFQVIRPASLDQALEAMADGGGEARAVPLAGGTDLFVYLNAGTWSSRRYLDLWGLRELGGIRATAEGVRLGALTTFSEIREHPVLRRRYPSLVAAAAEVGARQIQNRATLGGNIANASPAGDSLPVLLALDAVVHARSCRGSRRIPFAEIYRGYRQLALDPDELITGVALPAPLPRTFQFFRKVGTRRAQSISKVVLCGVLRQDRRGAVDHVRIAYGSVAPVTVRARKAEDELWNARPSPESAARARAALLDDIAPIDDIRSDRDYRLAVAGNLLAQFLRAADPRFAAG